MNRSLIDILRAMAICQNQKKGSFKNLAVIYKESYARGIEIYFAKKRYGGSESSYSGWFYRDYTGIVADLMDATTKTADMKKNIDNVSGFTINQIETAFFNSNSMDAMKAYLKEKYPSGKDGRKYTSSDMDKLFNYWINL